MLNCQRVTLFFWLVFFRHPFEKCDFVTWDEMKFPTEWKVIQNSMVPVTTNPVLCGDPLN